MTRAVAALAVAGAAIAGYLTWVHYAGIDPYCVGVRRAYIDCYGDAEVTPFNAEIRELTPVPDLGAIEQLQPDVQLVQIGRKRAATEEL